MIDYSGHNVLVTGGASGIGAALATGLAARGARVAVADRNLEGAEAVAARIGGGAVAPGRVNRPGQGKRPRAATERRGRARPKANLNSGMGGKAQVAAEGDRAGQQGRPRIGVNAVDPPAPVGGRAEALSQATPPPQEPGRPRPQAEGGPG